jgi:hypothetical protein
VDPKIKHYDYFIIPILLLAIFISFSFNKKNSFDSNDAISNNQLQKFSDTLFQSGDIIFRDGRGIISNIFRRLSLKDPKYSHAGIIHVENKNIFVYHMLGGEGGKNNTMRKERIESFCNSFQSNGFGVYRTDQNAASIDSLATVYYNKHIVFDDKFNLSTDDQMYCTELIYKILKEVSGQDNFLPLTAFSGTKYIACDDIFLSSHLRLIQNRKY